MSSPSAALNSRLSSDRRFTFDCLRGALAFLLVLLHMAQMDLVPLPQAWTHQRLISVGLFFTLSGFLVTWSMLQKPTFDRLAFAKARVQRIAPSYLLCILFALTISDASELFNKPLGWAMGNLFSHLTLTHAWFDGFSGGILPPLWTLSHEWAFYAFVLCMGGVLRSRYWWLPVLLVLVGALVSRYGLKNEWFTLANGYRHPFCIMDFFAPGVALAVLLQNEKIQRWLKSGRVLFGVFVLGVALTGWALSKHYAFSFRLDSAQYEGQGLQFYFAFERLFLKSNSAVLYYQPALASGATLLMLVLWMRPSWPARLLKFSPLSWMGKVSYSTYLWHMMVIACFVRAQKRIVEGSFWDQPWVMCLATFAAVYGISAVAWLYLEKPFLVRKQATVKSDRVAQETALMPTNTAAAHTGTSQREDSPAAASPAAPGLTI